MTPTPKPPVRSDRRRVQRNSIPFGLHVLVEYGIGVLTILSPFLFSFDDDAAQIVAVLIGAGILVLAVVRTLQRDWRGHCRSPRTWCWTTCLVCCSS